MYKRRLAAAIASRPRRIDNNRWFARFLCATSGALCLLAVFSWAVFVVKRSLAADVIDAVEGEVVVPEVVLSAPRPFGNSSIPMLQDESPDLSASSQLSDVLTSHSSTLTSPVVLNLHVAVASEQISTHPNSQPSTPSPETQVFINDARPIPINVVSSNATSVSENIPPLPAGKKALLFTMDSITDYVRRAAGGGPAGEILVRESLAWGLAELGISLDVATSDAEFARLSSTPDDYALFFLDPWTYVAPGWTPRAFLAGREQRTFLLSFFGLGAVEHGLKLPLTHVLTPYPLGGGNTFLGFAMHPRWLPRESGGGGVSVASNNVAGTAAAPTLLPAPAKKRQGVVWGKRPEYFTGKAEILAAVATQVDSLIVTVAPGTVPGLDQINNLVHVRGRGVLLWAEYEEVGDGYLSSNIPPPLSPRLATWAETSGTSC
jgi:hypothetical protein